MEKPLVTAILDYLRHKRYTVDTQPGHLNIVYIEGLNPDGTLNTDAIDGWNDLRLVIDHDSDGQPICRLCHVATTEPGKAPTFSATAQKRGGVARIAFGQYKAWRVGFHKQSKHGKNHPALVQAAPVSVHRDANRNGIRDGRDNVHVGRFGINQHSTQPGYRGNSVGFFSEGCLVGYLWEEHVNGFMPLVKADARYLADPDYLFVTTIIAGDDFCKWRESQQKPA